MMTQKEAVGMPMAVKSEHHIVLVNSGSKNGMLQIKSCAWT